MVKLELEYEEIVPFQVKISRFLSFYFINFFWLAFYYYLVSPTSQNKIAEVIDYNCALILTGAEPSLMQPYASSITKDNLKLKHEVE